MSKNIPLEVKGCPLTAPVGRPAVLRPSSTSGCSSSPGSPSDSSSNWGVKSASPTDHHVQSDGFSTRTQNRWKVLFTLIFRGELRESVIQTKCPLGPKILPLNEEETYTSMRGGRHLPHKSVIWIAGSKSSFCTVIRTKWTKHRNIVLVFVCLSVCLSVCLFVCLFVCTEHPRTKKTCRPFAQVLRSIFNALSFHAPFQSPTAEGCCLLLIRVFV